MIRILKLLFSMAALGCALPAFATWSLVQHPTKATCSGSSCAITVSSTGSNHVAIITVQLNTSSSVVISSVSGGGTWTHPAGCQQADAGGADVDAAYTLATSSGATSITVNLSATGGSNWSMGFEEASLTGTPSFDKCGVRDQSSSTTNPVGVSLSITGTNDFIVQSVRWGGTITCPMNSNPSGATYNSPCDAPGGNGIAGAINATTGNAPTWSSDNNSGPMNAIAIAESTSVVTCPPTVTMTGAGCGG